MFICMTEERDKILKTYIMETQKTVCCKIAPAH